MTRSYFEENVITAYDLYQFCYDYDLDYCSHWVSDDDLDGAVCSAICDMTSHDAWDTIRDFLNGIEEGYDYYDRDNSFSGISDDEVSDIIDDILENFDFDPEEDDEDDDDDGYTYDRDRRNNPNDRVLVATPPKRDEVQQLDSGGMNVQELF